MARKSSGSASIVVLVTCPTRAVAQRIALRVIGQRLAACVNILPGIESVFWWQGRVDRAREVLLLIKTTARRFEALRRAMLLLHPYQVPEVIALPIVKGHTPYLRWVQSCVAYNPRT